MDSGQWIVDRGWKELIKEQNHHLRRLYLLINLLPPSRCEKLVLEFPVVKIYCSIVQHQHEFRPTKTPSEAEGIKWAGCARRKDDAAKARRCITFRYVMLRYWNIYVYICVCLQSRNKVNIGGVGSIQFGQHFLRPGIFSRIRYQEEHKGRQHKTGNHV